jgi:hypothetical protein
LAISASVASTKVALSTLASPSSAVIAVADSSPTTTRVVLPGASIFGLYVRNPGMAPLRSQRVAGRSRTVTFAHLTLGGAA